MKTTRVIDVHGDGEIHLARHYGRWSLCGQLKVNWPAIEHYESPVSCEICRDMYVAEATRQALRFVGFDVVESEGSKIVPVEEEMIA